MSLAVEGCQIQRITRNISGVQVRKARFFNGKGDRNDAAAGGDIGHNGYATGIEHSPACTQRNLDKQFCLRPWDEDTFIDDKFTPVELLMPNKIRCRLTMFAPLNQREKLPLLLWRKQAFRISK